MSDWQQDLMSNHFGSLAYAIGAMTGDGSVKAYPVKGYEDSAISRDVHMTCRDADCVQRTCVEINDFFQTSYKISSFVNPNGTIMFGVRPRKTVIYDFFHYFIGDKLTLHEEIFRADKQDKLNFLAGLFDTDGWVTEYNKPNARYGAGWEVGWGAKHVTLVEDVIKLLIGLGVKANKISSKISGFGTTMYNIRPNVCSFVEAGCYFQIPRKAKQLRHYTEAVIPNFRQTSLSSPNTTGDISQVVSSNRGG